MERTNYFNVMVASVISMSLIAGQVGAQEVLAPAATNPTSMPTQPPLAAVLPTIPAGQTAATGSMDASQWEQEFALWQAAAQGNTIDEYQSYISAYPTGKFTSIAQARIVKLTATTDDIVTSDINGDASPAALQETSAFSVGGPAEEALIMGDRSTRREVQGRLSALGFNTGGTDGVLGSRSRSAISQWQSVVSGPVTGYLSYDQLAKLRADSQPVYQSWLASRPKPAPRRGPGSGDVLVGRVDSGADAAIALGVLGLAAGVIGGVAASGHHRHHGPRRYHGARFHRHR